MKTQNVRHTEGDEADHRVHRKVDVSGQHDQRLAGGGDGDDRGQDGDLRQVRHRQELRRLGKDETAQREHHDEQAQFALASQAAHAPDVT